MQPLDLEREGQRVMAVCNACRYCEQYCPMFRAMEERVTFASADLAYLANLCHACGECLYACQYAPPHEFAINVPRTLAQTRVQSYERYAWPSAFATAFRYQGITSALLLAGALVTLLLAAALLAHGPALLAPGGGADFYAVVPHGVLATAFGAAGVFLLVAIAMGLRRCWRDFGAAAIADDGRAPAGRGLRAMLRDALTLRHLHVDGVDCVTGLEVRTPWRRIWHHATFYGFLLCFASTSVAALYHWTGSVAPYSYTSLPVVLGTLGGIGLLLGPAGLLWQRRSRDTELQDSTHEDLDRAFLVLLWLTSATGLLLLGLRHHDAMAVLLLVHLGVVLALFVSLPYGKFVHGFYRAAALLRYHRDRAASGHG